MKIEQYISTLLYKYDCVIVPGLGGFVANYKSATVQLIQNTFSPPSKSISFNKNLNNNDGLLASFIVQKEACNFDVATKKIEVCVADINRELKLKRSTFLANIGTLFLDSENRMQFEPESTKNYLLESYGLPKYQKQPINRITIEEKITNKLIDKTTVLVAVKDGENKTSKKWMYSAAIVFLAFGSGWMINNTDLSDDLNYANLNPFQNIKPIYSPIKNNLSVPELTDITIKDQINSANQNNLFVSVKFDEKENPIIVKLKEQKNAEPISTYVKTSENKFQYHIIGGCFFEKKNAKKLVKQLKKEGFNAFILGKRKGFWTVSYISYFTREEADNTLENIQSHNDKAWILDHSF